MRAETPHEAAVQLLTALRCCKECGEQEIDLLELRQLDYRKQLLAAQLKELTFRGEQVQRLEQEVIDLGSLALQLQRENQQAYHLGIQSIQKINLQRCTLQIKRKDQIQEELEQERRLNIQLNDQLHTLTERVKQLNRINNEIYLNYTPFI